MRQKIIPDHAISFLSLTNSCFRDPKFVLGSKSFYYPTPLMTRVGGKIVPGNHGQGVNFPYPQKEAREWTTLPVPSLPNPHPAALLLTALGYSSKSTMLLLPISIWLKY